MDNRIDAEEIGALLDGRVAEPRRSELLTRLEQDDEGYDLFADTAAVLREAEEGASEKAPEHVREDEPAPVTTTVIPLRPRQAGWRRPPARWMALAAALAALALVPVLRSRMNESAWRNPERLVTMSGQSGAGLPKPWTHSWAVKRGGEIIAENTGAAQVGTLHMDLVVEAHSSGPVDTARVAQLAGDAAATLQKINQTWANLAAGEYGAIADSTQWSGPELLRRLAAARSTILDAIGTPDYFTLGAWTEAARLAANRQDAAFFRARGSQLALEQAASLPDLRDDARAAAKRILSMQDQGEIRDWNGLRTALEVLQHGLAS